MNPIEKALEALEPDTIHVPWSPAEVVLLEEHQADPKRHPYTCPGHMPGGCWKRELRPTVDGWICACLKYRQSWAHNPRKKP